TLSWTLARDRRSARRHHPRAPRPRADHPARGAERGRGRCARRTGSRARERRDRGVGSGRGSPHESRRPRLVPRPVTSMGAGALRAQSSSAIIAETMTAVTKRIEAVDPTVAEALRRMSGMERLRLGHETWELTRDRLVAYIAYRHPGWTSEEIQRQVARRLL